MAALRHLTVEEKYNSLVNYIKTLNRSYASGAAMSMAESIIGESVTKEILNYVVDIETKFAEAPIAIKEENV